MARILLVSEKVSVTAWRLAQALKTQQHEVYFLTGRNETVPDTEGIELLSFFKTWSTFEATKFVPTALALRPQIVHFVMESDKATGAHMLLWALSQSGLGAVFTISLLNIHRGLHRRNWVRYLVQSSDIVTCASVDALVHLRGLEMRSPKQGRGLLPPVLAMPETTPASESELLDLLKDQRFILRPFAIPHFDPEDAFFRDLVQALQHKAVVLYGSYDHWSVRERKRFHLWLDENATQAWYITGLKTTDQISSLLHEAQALWLAGLDLSPAELTEFYFLALDQKATAILDRRQARLHAPLWRDQENAWLVENHSLESLFTKPDLKLNYELDHVSLNRRELIDAPINDLNRLYNKALTQK